MLYQRGEKTACTERRSRRVIHRRRRQANHARARATWTRRQSHNYLHSGSVSDAVRCVRAAAPLALMLQPMLQLL